MLLLVSVQETVPQPDLGMQAATLSQVLIVACHVCNHRALYHPGKARPRARGFVAACPYAYVSSGPRHVINRRAVRGQLATFPVLCCFLRTPGGRNTDQQRRHEGFDGHQQLSVFANVKDVKHAAVQLDVT